MQVALEQSTYDIIFQHNPQLKVSSCVVLKDGKIVGTSLIGGQTKACFSKDSSRKRALSQAIKRLPVSDRYEIWNHHYRTMTATPRWPEQKMTEDLKHRLFIREMNRLRMENEFKKKREDKKKRIAIKNVVSSLPESHNASVVPLNGTASRKSTSKSTGRSTKTAKLAAKNS